MTKFLGVDYGTKRIGIAISDNEGKIAFPRGIIVNNSETLQRISEIFEKENIDEIVIGESLDFSGNPNKISPDIEIFILELKKRFEIIIHKQKEFLTSVEARGKNGKEIKNSRKTKKNKTQKVDASAAALILQRYLDKLNNKND